MGHVVSATVIAYHGVGDPPAGGDPYRMWTPLAHFRRHMAFLSAHRDVVSLRAVLAGVRTRRPAVAITFDDGYESVLTSAAPILAEHGFPATCFVPTAWLGRRKGWDPLDRDATPLPIMCADQLKQIAALGHAVESHGHRHTRLDAMTYDEAREDIERSIEVLTEVNGEAPRLLAYPWGAHAEHVRQAAADIRLAAAFSIGQVGIGNFARERVTIRPTDGLTLFAYKTSGHYLASRELPVVRQVHRRLLLPLLQRRRSMRT